MKLAILLLLSGCLASPGAPVMERKVKVWNGAPEEGGICRMSSASIAKLIKKPFKEVRAHHLGTTDMECLDAREEQFKQYACLTFEDLGVIYGYIQALNQQCKKW